jgi:hypothetical protein
MAYDLEIGPHRFGFSPPSTVRLLFAGDIEEEHARRVIDAIRRTTSERPFAILLETPGLKSVTPSARKAFADGFKAMPLVGAAFVGASIRTRAIATFVITAINVFRDTKMTVVFSETEDDARAWIAAQLSTSTSAGDSPVSAAVSKRGAGEA